MYYGVVFLVLMINGLLIRKELYKKCLFFSHFQDPECGSDVPLDNEEALLQPEMEQKVGQTN